MKLGLGIGLIAAQVAPPLALSPASANVESGLTQQFTASGGGGSYSYSIATNNTGGLINSSTGLYTAGPTPGTDAIRATSGASHVDSSAIVSWTPHSLSGTVLSWRRADLGVTTGATYTWADLNGSGDANRNASQSTALKQPGAPATNAKLGGQMSIPFAAAQGLVTGVYSVAPSTSTLTIIGVFSDGATGSYVSDSLNADAGCHLEVQNGSGFVFGGSSQIFGSAYDTNGHAVVCLANGATSSERKDNMTTTDVTGTTVIAATGFTIGADKAISGAAGLKLAEHVVINGTLSAGDKTSLRAYLQTRYGLTIGA